MAMAEATREETTWKCEFCSQTVLLDVEGTPWFPPGFAENCPLKDHMIGYECIAFRDRERAQRLLDLGEGRRSTLAYDDQVAIDESRDVVLSWLRDSKGISRIRVEAPRDAIADSWRLDWNNKAAMIDEFTRRREGYRDVAIREARRERDYYVYVIKK